MISREDKERSEVLSRDIAKYAIALGIYMGFPNARCEIAHCHENLERLTDELLMITRSYGSACGLCSHWEDECKCSEYGLR